MEELASKRSLERTNVNVKKDSEDLTVKVKITFSTIKRNDKIQRYFAYQILITIKFMC